MLQKYSECNYNNYFEFLYWRWFEMKKWEKYTSEMDPHKFSFAVDSLHHLASLWACEDSLWHHHPKSHPSIFVFQDLHYQREKGSFQNDN